MSSINDTLGQINKMDCDFIIQDTKYNNNIQKLRTSFQKKIIDSKDYTNTIDQNLPQLSNLLFPISARNLYFNHTQYTMLTEDDWEPFGVERQVELQRIEDSMFYQQLKMNNLEHGFKLIYEELHDIYDNWGIPYKNRHLLFNKEIEYISLLMHDVLPYNYSEQGIWCGDTSLSNYFKFFDKNDNITVARKKWLDFLGPDYYYFWDVVSNKIKLHKINEVDIVKLDEMMDIIMFINPEGLNTMLHFKEAYNRVLYIKLRSKEVKYWVPTRPRTFYIWKLFGWSHLHPKLPSFDSGNNIGKGQPQFLSRWTSNMLTYQEYFVKDLFFINKSFSGENSAWIFYYKMLHSEQEKNKYIQENYFHSDFLLQFSEIWKTTSTSNYAFTKHFSERSKRNIPKLYVSTTATIL